MTHIGVGELTVIVSDIWTNADIVLIWPYETNFSEILIEILTFSFTKISLKVSSAKWRPFCLGLNVLSKVYIITANALISHDQDGLTVTENYFAKVHETFHTSFIVSNGMNDSIPIYNISYIHTIKLNHLKW